MTTKTGKWEYPGVLPEETPDECHMINVFDSSETFEQSAARIKLWTNNSMNCGRLLISSADELSDLNSFKRLVAQRLHNCFSMIRYKTLVVVFPQPSTLVITVFSIRIMGQHLLIGSIIARDYLGSIGLCVLWKAYMQHPFLRRRRNQSCDDRIFVKWPCLTNNFESKKRHKFFRLGIYRLLCASLSWLGALE